MNPQHSQLSLQQAARTTTGLAKYKGAWTKNEAQHLAKRCLFGSPKTDIDQFLKLGLSGSLDQLLNYTTPLPAPPVNDYSSGTYKDPVVAPGETWVNNNSNDGGIQSNRISSLRRWWVGEMINQQSNIREKMTLFWVNFFGTEMVEVGNANWMYKHYTLLRQNALGNFRLLVRAVTTDVAMLRYLNGAVNTASAPDENYARELQELFTLGKGPAVQYTEADIRTAARILTGWRINTTTYTSYFDPARHDTNPKTFSSYYGGKTIAGKTGAAGATETDELIDMIFLKDEVSKFICRRLYRWFVYYKIDAAIELNVIEPLAKIFRDNNYEIKPVMRALLESEHFFDVLNQGCIIKSPIDSVIGCFREFNVTFPASSSYVNLYMFWQYVANWMANMNQNPGDPPDVSGWPAYYQEPQYHEIWITADTLVRRNRLADTLLTSGYVYFGHKLYIDVVLFVKTLNNASNPNLLIDEILSIIYRAPLASDIKQTLKQQLLLSNQTDDNYWTSAWNAYVGNPSAANYNIVFNRLRPLFQYLLSLPEYQLS